MKLSIDGDHYSETGKDAEALHSAPVFSATELTGDDIITWYMSLRQNATLVYTNLSQRTFAGMPPRAQLHILERYSRIMIQIAQLEEKFGPLLRFHPGYASEQPVEEPNAKAH